MKRVRVRTSPVLYEEVGRTKSRNTSQESGGLRIANHYGCHYLKPSEIYENFDQVKIPIHSMNWSL